MLEALNRFNRILLPLKILASILLPTSVDSRCRILACMLLGAGSILYVLWKVPRTKMMLYKRLIIIRKLLDPVQKVHTHL